VADCHSARKDRPACRSGSSSQAGRHQGGHALGGGVDVGTGAAGITEVVPAPVGLLRRPDVGHGGRRHRLTGRLLGDGGHQGGPEGAVRAAGLEPGVDGREQVAPAVALGVERGRGQPERQSHQHGQLGRRPRVEGPVGLVVEHVEGVVTTGHGGLYGGEGLGLAPATACLRLLGDGDHGVRGLEAGETGQLEAAVGELLVSQPGRGAGGRRPGLGVGETVVAAAAEAVERIATAPVATRVLGVGMGAPWFGGRGVGSGGRCGLGDTGERGVEVGARVGRVTGSDPAMATAGPVGRHGWCCRGRGPRHADGGGGGVDRPGGMSPAEHPWPHGKTGDGRRGERASVARRDPVGPGQVPPATTRRLRPRSASPTATNVVPART
jgi:hypothetical protein